MNILICSQQGEIQVDAVSSKLREKGFNPVLFERYRRDHFIKVQYGSINLNQLTLEGKTYPLDYDTFPVVWYRPKPILTSELPGEDGTIAEKFSIREWYEILKSFESLLTDSKWVNPLHCGWKASNKVHQLKMAASFGLLIPETIISNAATEILELFDGGRVIYKTLNTFFTSEKAIYTNEITRGDVLKREEEIAMAPGIFQKLIEKEFELRVTVVGCNLSVVQINSQEHIGTMVDWRKAPDPKMYQIGTLSRETTQKLLSLHQHLGLVYAAYDFIVDKDGNEIFLECNPSGQWLWLDHALELDISDMMVHELTTL